MNRPLTSPSQEQEPKPTWRERLRALRSLRPLLVMVWQTHPAYVTAILALRALRAEVPVAVMWIGKLIIDWAKAGMDAHHAGLPIHWDSLAVLLAVGLGIAVAGTRWRGPTRWSRACWATCSATGSACD